MKESATTTLPASVEIIEHNDVKWISVDQPDKEALDYLREHFDFHALDYEDVMSTTHRSKVDKYEEYLFLILLFPIFNRKNKQIESSEMDFFLGRDYLITIHRSKIPTYSDMFQLCQASEQARDSHMNHSSQFLLYKILQRMFQYIYPIMDHVDLEIQELENRIFEGGEKELVQEILVVRHNIIDMRKLMQPHRAALFRLKKPSVDLVDHHNFELSDEYEDYFDDLLDYTQEIWNQLESFKESVDALHETNESLISYRINEVMKTLTLFSVVMLPASVVAGIFGMNAQNMPFVGGPQDFWIMIIVTFLAIAGTLFYIRRKHLL